MKTNFFSRFIVVGIINTIIGISTMYLLYHLGISYWIATCTGNVVGAIVSYFLNRSFTFQSTKPINQTIALFLVVIATCYIIAYTISYHVTIQFVQIIELTASIPAEDIAILFGAVLYTILNYFGQKQLVFNR
ncbi:GtrA family protein [Aquibacillus kalidii]|uniref:GtrA family protein n=1 Tax=Aquibacillus kalidii TaxID=2762597 RepID=UPI00164707A9|nr:GtrA family protein [Aquibacillus kalidii]